MTSHDLGVKLTPISPLSHFVTNLRTPLQNDVTCSLLPLAKWWLLAYCQSQWQSNVIDLQSIGLMHQFYSQHYRHPAVDCRVVLPAMTITDSTHWPAYDILWVTKSRAWRHNTQSSPTPFVTFRHTSMNLPPWVWRHLWKTPQYNAVMTSSSLSSAARSSVDWGSWSSASDWSVSDAESVIGRSVSASITAASLISSISARRNCISNHRSLINSFLFV